jgi:hypothetical protein
MEHKHSRRSKSSNLRQKKSVLKPQPSIDDSVIRDLEKPHTHEKRTKVVRASFNIANIPAHSSQQEVNLQQGAAQPILMAGAIAVSGGAERLGLWEFMKREIIKRAPVLAAKVAGLSLVDGALPIGELIGLGLTLWTIKEIYDAYQVYMSTSEESSGEKTESEQQNSDQEQSTEQEQVSDPGKLTRGGKKKIGNLEQ